MDCGSDMSRGRVFLRLYQANERRIYGFILALVPDSAIRDGPSVIPESQERQERQERQESQESQERQDIQRWSS